MLCSPEAALRRSIQVVFQGSRGYPEMLSEVGSGGSWCSDCLIWIFFYLFWQHINSALHHSEGDILKYLRCSLRPVMTNDLRRWEEKNGRWLFLQSLPCVKRTSQGQLSEQTYQLLLSFCVPNGLWRGEEEIKLQLCSCTSLPEALV